MDLAGGAACVPENNQPKVLSELDIRIGTFEDCLSEASSAESALHIRIYNELSTCRAFSGVHAAPPAADTKQLHIAKRNCQ